jgi:hypothetical protein
VVVLIASHRFFDQASFLSFDKKRHQAWYLVGGDFHLKHNQNISQNIDYH